MARDEPPRPGLERYREFQNAHWSAKVQVHPKTLGKVPLMWDFVVSTENTLIERKHFIYPGPPSSSFFVFLFFDTNESLYKFIANPLLFLWIKWYGLKFKVTFHPDRAVPWSLWGGWNFILNVINDFIETAWHMTPLLVESFAKTGPKFDGMAGPEGDVTAVHLLSY
jgi:hypothetical protein